MLALAAVFAQVVFTSTYVSADLFDFGDITGSGAFHSGSFDNIMDDIEQRYHLNTQSVQGFGENLDVSERKSDAPSVMLFFNPTDPKPGEETVAEALPTFFSSNADTMYYTWYLKREQCDLKTKGEGLSDLEKEMCDLDNDGNITVNDWKIEAMRKIANGGFDPEEQSDYDTDDDHDGYDTRSMYGGDKSANRYCYIHDFTSGANYELTGCTHLFANDDDPSTRTGDGTFNRSEEKFWMTDTHDPSTAQNGNKDEANVVGLGQSKFKWNYAAGDKVGVVVEGVSMIPTKHSDASKMVMWAFLKNKCAPTGSFGSTTGTSYNGGTASISTISMTSNDLNACLKNNLVDPTEGDQAGQLNVQTIYSPENPIIDSFSTDQPDKQGNILTVRSSLANSATDPSRISYEWDVYANKNKTAGDDRAWEKITADLQSEKAITTTKGSDLSELKVNLNLSEGNDIFSKYFDTDGIGYFRVNVTVRENFVSGKIRIGRSSVVVKVTRFGNQLETHSVVVDTTGKLKLATGTLCEDSVVERTICPVVRGQIVGATLSASAADDFTDFSWLLNEKPLRCEDRVSGSSGCRSGRENFFPVTGNPGEVYTLTLTANNVETGKTVTLNRIFTIVDPSIVVVSADNGKTAWPKWLGQYVDENGSATDDYSPNVFETFSGGTFALKGMFYPSSLKNNASAYWLVDGNQAIPDSTTGTVNIAVSKPAGSVYSVDLKGLYVPSSVIKKALHDIWGLSISDFNETTLTSDIQVEVVQSVDGLAMGPLETSKKFFAAIVSYVPASVLFFFRLVVTMALILLVIGVAFSFAPEFVSEKRRQ